MTVAPELLAPAGDWDCVRAAIANGADAIYFGLDTGFNARARATNFPLADLPRLAAALHHHGVKGYATLNTLVFSAELEAFAELVAAVAAAGIDAILVQDVGAARLARAVCPDLPLHASTQMTLTSAECIALAEELAIERVVVARELAVSEIAAIARGTTLPLEVFVHGALCVAYSGQCLTSESLGGRSANRGQCAQACRLPYDLVCDGRDVDLGERRYLLSPQDLAAYALVPDLIAAGVRALKIEGRLKTPEYVAAVTRHYRTAIDAAVAGRPVDFTPREIEDLELTFSRGFSPGWLRGCDHKMLVPADSSAKRGVRLGTVAAVRGSRIVVDLAAGLAGGVDRGDGVGFACGATSDEAVGGRVYEVWQAGRRLEGPALSGRVELGFAHDALDPRTIPAGAAVWKTDDPRLTSRLRRSFAAAPPPRRQPVDLEVVAAVGAPVRVRASTDAGPVGEVATDVPAVAAEKHPLDEAVLATQLGRLGGTTHVLRQLTARIDGRPMVPLSVLGRLRKALVALLDEAAAVRPQRRVAVDAWRTLRPRPTPPASGLPVLHVLVRSLEQLHALLAAGERRLIADLADIRLGRDVVEACRGAGASATLATPRIHKPDETGIFRLLAKHAPDAILARNHAAVRFFAAAGLPVVGDFSLNVANELAAAFFQSAGCTRLTASYDCNREQLGELVSSTPADWLEVVVHQHMPLFHMEHCVFCAVLSPGTDKTNCGRPCDDHVVSLRDRVGVSHRLTADVGCRNTLFNALPQSAAEAVPGLVAAGVRHLRIELLDETGPDAVRVVSAYRDLLAGRLRGGEVWKSLQAANQVGVTRGTLEERKNPLAIL